jgi:hypothetical protein
VESAAPDDQKKFNLQELKLFVERFASEQLTPFAVEIEASNRQFRRKEINDPLWGTISLSPVEVALLDTPLLQRLRYIRQLGVVHWIYPGAGHTRFARLLSYSPPVGRMASM